VTTCRSLVVLGMALGLTGFSVLFLYVGPVPALAVFLMMWGDNLVRHAND
jgi:hypothetical protein